MAINKNHEFEELEGVKCAIVERTASQERMAFLKTLLEVNHFTVVAVPAMPPKAAIPAPAEEETQAIAAPATYTIGVTDVSFNPVNAIFGRLLKTKSGRVVTLAYWQQKESEPKDEIPYFENKGEMNSTQKKRD